MDVNDINSYEKLKLVVFLYIRIFKRKGGRFAKTSNTIKHEKDIDCSVVSNIKTNYLCWDFNMVQEFYRVLATIIVL